MTSSGLSHVTFIVRDLARMERILTEVLVDKGSRVTKGQPLAVVTDPALIYTADKTKAELDEKLRRADERSSPVIAEFDAKIQAMGDMLAIARRAVELHPDD